MITSEEKKESAFRLGKMILAFFQDYPDATNQEIVEILGVAVMYFHCATYVMTLSGISEKP